MSAFDTAVAGGASSGGGGGGGAAPGEVKVFQAGHVPVGYTQVSGEPATFGNAKFVVCRRPDPTPDGYRLARGRDGVHAVWINNGTAVPGHAVYDEVNDVWLPRAVSASWIAAYPFANFTWGLGAFVGMPDGRIFHSSVPTYSGTALATIFDPATNAWTDVAPPPAPLIHYSGAMLGDGRILLAGGYQSGGPAYAYNPATNSWETLAGPDHPNVPAIVMLPSGKALLITNALYSIFNPATNTFTPYASLPAWTSDRGQGGALMPTDTGAICVTNVTTDDVNPRGAMFYTEATDVWAYSNHVFTPYTGSRAGAMAKLNSGGYMLVTDAVSPAPGFVKYLSDYTPQSLVQAKKD